MALGSVGLSCRLRWDVSGCPSCRPFQLKDRGLGRVPTAGQTDDGLATTTRGPFVPVRGCRQIIKIYPGDVPIKPIVVGGRVALARPLGLAPFRPRRGSWSAHVGRNVVVGDVFRDGPTCA